MHRPRIVFMGTPVFAVPSLQILLDHGHQVVAVYSQPPRPAGRGYHLQKSPVHEIAEKYNIPVETPLKLKGNDDALEKFRSFSPDLTVVIAYGLILPKNVLEIPPLGCVNLHASLLPRWRGAAPIQRAIMAGDVETGVTLMQMDQGLDTGGMFATLKCSITETTTAPILHDQLSELSAQILIENLPALLNRTLCATPQPCAGVTYAEKISKEEGCISWQDSAIDIERRIRALTPWPGTFFEYQNQVFKVGSAKAISLDHHYTPGMIIDLSCSSSSRGQSLFLDSRQSLPSTTIGGGNDEGRGRNDSILPSSSSSRGQKGRVGDPGIPAVAVNDEGNKKAIEKSSRLVIACGTGALEILTLQKPGGKMIPIAEFLRGYSF